MPQYKPEPNAAGASIDAINHTLKRLHSFRRGPWEDPVNIASVSLCQKLMDGETELSEVEEAQYRELIEAYS